MAPEAFAQHRPRLMAIAYRMLGSLADAEDVVQDAWLRFTTAQPTDLQSEEAWLVTVTTRLAIDRLRQAKTEREKYPGFWLPEPLLTEDGPERMLELAGDVSLAFLAVLERLTPDERAAFLLREVFDADYPDVASTLGKSEAACRQLVSRAKAQIRNEKARFNVSRDEHLRLLEKFAQAAKTGSLAEIRALIADHATLVSDGGGVVPSFGKVIEGAQRLAGYYHAWSRRLGSLFEARITSINGVPGLLLFADGKLDSVQQLRFEDGKLAEIHVQRNPVKLARFAAQLEIELLSQKR